MGLAPTQGSEKRLGPRIHSLSNRYLFLVIPTGANPDFLPRSARQGRVCAFLLRKMGSVNAIKVHRKSGEAERKDLRFSPPAPKT
jgi:hypothetical protein